MAIKQLALWDDEKPSIPQAPTIQESQEAYERKFLRNGEDSSGKALTIAYKLRTIERYQVWCKKVKSESENNDDIDNVSSEDIEKYALEVFKEIDNPTTWAALVGDNQNVTYL